MQISEMHNRWNEASTVAGHRVLELSGDTGPFGTTDEGLVDLRGMPLPSVRLVGVSLVGLDLSHARNGCLILVDSKLASSKFDNAEVKLLDLCSSFVGVSFNRANMQSSGLCRKSKYVDCTFQGTDLSHINGNDGEFRNCSFDDAKVTGVFRGTLFSQCVIAGTLADSIFDNDVAFRNCDLRNSVFVDCGFYRARFIDCMLADHAMLFTDSWPSVVRRFKEEAQRQNPSIRKWLVAEAIGWEQTLEGTLDHLVDRGIIDALGEEAGTIAYKILRGLRAS